MRDVPIPPGLKSRLILALTDAAESFAAPPPSKASVGQSVPVPRYRRRWVLSAVAAAAAVALVGGVSWKLLQQDEPAPLALQTVRDYFAGRLGDADGPALPAFKADWDAQIMDGRWKNLASLEPSGADIDGDGRQDAALYALSNGAYLVVLAPGRIADPPASGSALSATRVYFPMTHVAWTLKEQVYICFVPGGPDKLQQVLDAVYGRVG